MRVCELKAEKWMRINCKVCSCRGRAAGDFFYKMADAAQNGGFELTFREQVMLLGTARKWYGSVLDQVCVCAVLIHNIFSSLR